MISLFVAIKLITCFSLVLTITSCTNQLPDRAASPKPVAATTKTLVVTPTPSEPAVKRVVNEWRPGSFQNGIQIYWHFIGNDKAVIAKSDQLLDYVVSVGANSVGISFPIYTNGAKPTRVYAGTDTPSPQQLSIVVNEAKERGLRVMIRPIINEANIVAQSPHAWRGSIQPPNVRGWFASYAQLLVGYSAVATRYKVEEFVAGTELVSLNHFTREWRRVTARLVVAGYRGTVSYSSNFNEKPNSAFRALGFDAYPSVHLPDSATVPQLSAAIGKWLNQQPASVRSRLTLQEVGITARNGVYAHPWYWASSTGPLNFTVQSNWFSAMCSSAHAGGLQGIYYWSVDTNVDWSSLNPNTDYSGSFIGRPAESSIKTCFTSS